MGMAASQARLLSLTARLHDVEYEAQAIQNAKMALATQSDQVYNEYLEALDSTTLTVSAMENGEKYTVAANFNNLCSVNRVLPADGSEFALFDKYNRLIVSDDVYEGYKNFLKQTDYDDAYSFAIYMLGFSWGVGNSVFDGSDSSAGIEAIEEEVYQNHRQNNQSLENIRKEIEEFLSNNSEDDEAVDIYNSTGLSDEDLEKYNELMDYYKYKLYSLYSQEIYDNACNEADLGFDIENSDYDREKFNYYVSIFKQIEANGGCISISSFDKTEYCDAANNSDWLQSMIQSGQITVSTVKTDKKDGAVSFVGEGVSSSTTLRYSATSEIDKKAIAKAEAQYEHDLKEIDRKDKKFDMTLSKLETERTAITKEVESVKKVIEDNIDRTFGIFS